jgi:hypothetical protein
MLFGQANKLLMKLDKPSHEGHFFRPNCTYFFVFITFSDDSLSVYIDFISLTIVQLTSRISRTD